MWSLQWEGVFSIFYKQELPNILEDPIYKNCKNIYNKLDIPGYLYIHNNLDISDFY